MMSQCSGIPIKYFDTKFGYSRINEMLLNIIVSVYFRMGKLNDASFFSFTEKLRALGVPFVSEGSLRAEGHTMN